MAVRFPNLRLRDPTPELLDFPWSTPLEQWPADRIAIEAVLLERPATVRAWVPGETVDDLKLQNVMHRGRA